MSRSEFAAAAGSRSRLVTAADRVLDALADAGSRDRTMLALIVAYVAVWTLYGVLAKASQDVHYDMAELVTLSRELALGYPRHPPLAALVVKAWFAVFPIADWSFYLLAMTVVGVTLWIVWRLSADFLDGDKRTLAVLLLTLLPFFNFHALKYNVNTVLLPLWAATALWFLRSYRTRGIRDAALAGLLAAAAMLGKYWSVMLLAGLGIAALCDRRRAAYFRSPAPWITIAVGMVAMTPHLAWLAQHDFAPFNFAFSVHGEKSFTNALGASAGYLLGAAAYFAIPAAIVLAAARPSRAAILDTLVPQSADRRLCALAFWAPLLLPAVVAPIAGVHIVSLWTMSAWALLPIVLLSSGMVTIPRLAARWILLLITALPLLMLACAPVIAFAIHMAGVKPSAAHGRMLARAVEELWRETTDKPLLLVGGQADLAFSVAFYSSAKPSAFPDSNPEIAIWVDATRVAREGAAFVCETTDEGCIRRTNEYAAGAPLGLRREIVVSREFWGQPGEPARYLIVTVPPRR